MSGHTYFNETDYTEHSFRDNDSKSDDDSVSNEQLLAIRKKDETIRNLLSDNHELKRNNNELRDRLKSNGLLELAEENIMLKGEGKRMKEENAMLKGENERLKEENIKVRQWNQKLKEENESLVKAYNEVVSELRHHTLSVERKRLMNDGASSEYKQTETTLWLGDGAPHNSSTHSSLDAESGCWDVVFKITAVFALVTLLVIIFVQLSMLFI